MRFLIVACWLLSSIAVAAEKHYSLSIAEAPITIDGVPSVAMLINDQLPGQVLAFNEGDMAVITVHNKLASDASIHWHGLLLPQDQDGVPYVTFMPIPAGGTFTYRFPLSHAGTYWYHSHTNIDEQRGQYGAIVVSPKQARDIRYDYDQVVQLSDWTAENPREVLANLKKDGDWYAAKKDSVVSLAGYAKRGALANWFNNRWQRMEGMDVSDVGYDAFLANGQTQLALLPEAKAGEVVRLRFINSAASSYFTLQQQDTPFTVIAADGLDVQPITVGAIPMGMAETYDVLLTIPASGGAVLRANNIDGTGGVTITVGEPKNMLLPTFEGPDLYAQMDYSMHMGADHAGHTMAEHHQHMKAMRDEIPATLDYAMLKSTQPVHYRGEPRVVTLNLTGNMESYTWSFNGQTMTMADAIKISRGEVVRFVFNNTTMMHHPLHLHGHFFKVISGNGDYDVLKHTVDVPPMAKVVIEFLADAEKDWLFHCHNLYHAKAGMGRIVRYDDYAGNPAFMQAKKASSEIKDDDYYSKSEVALYSEGASVEANLSNIHYRFSADVEGSYASDVEATLRAAKQVAANAYLFAGFEYEQDESQHSEHHWQLGLNLKLPFLLDTDIWLDESGTAGLALASELRVSEKVLAEFDADTEGDWGVVAAWQQGPAFSWRIAASATIPVGVGFSYVW